MRCFLRAAKVTAMFTFFWLSLVVFPNPSMASFSVYSIAPRCWLSRESLKWFSGFVNRGSWSNTVGSGFSGSSPGCGSST